MKNMKFWRTALVATLVLTVILSVTGGTIAWFTDTVTSESNIIKSGTLKVEMAWSDTCEGTYKDASKGAIFDYKLWEPGYTDVKYVEVKNAGNLAFQFKLNIKPTGVRGTVVLNGDETDPNSYTFTPSEPTPEYFLEDVIEVYMVPGNKQYASFDEIKAAAGPNYKPQTISELIADEDGAAYGVLLPVGTEDATLPVGSEKVCIALHMQETAGNEYQNLSIGDGFALQLEATQYTYEQDSFGNSNYDVDAEYAGLPAAVVIELTEEEIKASSYPMMEAAYMFRTTVTPDVKANPELLNDPYRKWHADFAVSFDKDVNANTVALCGQYDSWSDSWVGGENPAALKAGEEIRLLGGMISDMYQDISINYEELVAWVQQFNCGAYDVDNANTGTTMTVELRLYEVLPEGNYDGVQTANKESGKYVTIGVFEHTFEAE